MALGSLIGGAALGAFGMGLGVAESKKAEKEAKKWYSKAGERPVYDAPSEYASNSALAQSAFDSNLGMQGALEESMNAQAAASRKDLRRAGGSFSDLMEGSSRVASSMINTSLDSNLQLASNRARLMENLIRAQESLASSKEDEFEYNEAQRYAEFMGRGDAFENRRFSINQNIQQQLMDIGGAQMGSADFSKEQLNG